MENIKRNGKQHIELSWEGGYTNLFLAPRADGELELLDYEFDHERIHELCGGRCYYVSCSGCSGAGYINQYRDLIRVGFYRVDTSYNEFHYPEKITDEISIMLPYCSHERDKQDTLEKYPVVIMVGDSTIIYCGYYTNMNNTLTSILSGQELKQKPSILKRTFVNTKSYWKREEEVEIRFYNFFGRSFYPWEFATALLKDYSVYYPEERLYKIFRMSVCEDGTLVRTTRIGQKLYATRFLKDDPCEKADEAFPGWEFARTNMMYKVGENEVYIVGWQLADVAYQEKVERIARFIPASESREFKNFVEEYLPSSKYVEFEVTVPKLLFFLNKEMQFENVRKGISSKVREDVFYAARQFVAEFNDKRILEAIPDELIITLEDSYAAGNCKPGTKTFVDQFFPGRTETTAGELKKYANNWNVMRIFRYIATREMLDVKIELEFPVEEA